MPSTKEYANRMPAKKRSYSYYTLRMFRRHILERIAKEWWNLEPEGKTNAQLCEEILDSQDVTS